MVKGGQKEAKTLNGRQQEKFSREPLEREVRAVRYPFPAYSREKARRAVAALVRDGCARLGHELSFEEALRSLENPRENFGDIASKAAFMLRGKGNPKELAETIARNIEANPLVEKVETQGPYINFTLSSEYYSGVLHEVLGRGDCYGRGLKTNFVTLIEYPSVNPNKPWHAGHLRNAILGDCVAHGVEFAGGNTLRINYIDDLGLQVAQSIWGYLNLGSNVEGKADHWFGRQYVEVAEKLKDPKIESEVRALMHELEEGKGELCGKARKIVSEILRAQLETAFSLGIYHDALVWESDIVRSHLLQKGLGRLQEKEAVELVKEGDKAGCLVVKLKGVEEFAHMDDPDKILVRSDGTATYTGKDVSFQMWKFGLLEASFRFSTFLTQPNGKPLLTTDAGGRPSCLPHADAVVNVIGSEQSYPQAVVKYSLKAVGYGEQSENSVHLAYEHVELPEERFSGRSGNWVGFTADEIIATAVDKAREEVVKRFPEMASLERERIARDVGIGAVRYAFIRTSPEKRLVFNWKEALSFEGDSAPYVQYAHARACRLLEKCVGEGKRDASLLTHPKERALIKKLAEFPEVVNTSANLYRPHHVTAYLFELASSFNSFYMELEVLKAESEELRQARISLVEASRMVLRNAMGLLGVPAPERM